MQALDNRYLEGQITKYLFRYKDKNGAEDLQKSLHYCDKLMSCFREGSVQSMKDLGYSPTAPLDYLLAEHKLSHNVYRVCTLLPVWSSARNLEVIRYLITQEIDAYLAGQPTPEYVNQGGE